MKKNVVIRKFRKLINNPKAFFADAKIVKKLLVITVIIMMVITEENMFLEILY